MVITLREVCTQHQCDQFGAHSIEHKLSLLARSFVALILWFVPWRRGAIKRHQFCCSSRRSSPRSRSRRSAASSDVQSCTARVRQRDSDFTGKRLA